MLKLNLGCGQTGLPGWMNVDNSPTVLLNRAPALKKLLFKMKLMSRDAYEAKWADSVVWRDMSRGLGLAEGSADKAYNSHVLEHMTKEDGERFLREVHRVLKKGGIFRLVVPDLGYHCRRYLEDVEKKDAGRGPHDELLFNLYGAFTSKRRKGLHHAYMYDWPTLLELLTSIGFSSVKKADYRAGADPELCALDNRPGESLHIDAVK